MIQAGQAESLGLHIFIRDVPPLDSLPRPGRFPEKCETGFHAGIVEKTADRNATPHLSPPIPIDQFFDNGFQRNPVQRIAGMGKTHDRMANGMGLTADDSGQIAYSTYYE
ncbi:hypothetical protein AYO43_08220 [Nitrospira sp. SCGC AG-212-E16]|nr:hypothetical protein AYO43_08220 [Nitrospira sp. SCGC AG-212-E16]